MYEKIRTLRKIYSENNNERDMKKLYSILSLFKLNDFPSIKADVTVEKAKEILN